MDVLPVLGVLFGILIVVGGGALVLRLLSGWTGTAYCPYTGTPLRKAENLPFLTKYKVRKFMDAHIDFCNQPFKFYKAAFCRETGRIFPDCITWTGKIIVEWDFIQKRFPGKFVSWGSLTSDQQRELYQMHGLIDGFQTEFSSPTMLPKQVEPQYARAKPGPLYVDLDSGTLVGWIAVPETDVEILRVQRPPRMHSL